VNLINNKWVLSSRDLIAELECSHRLHLDVSALKQLVESPPKKFGPELELLIEKGVVHELRLIEKKKSEGSFKALFNPEPTLIGYTEAMAETLEAMQAGYEVISQATLYTGDFIGIVDFLVLEKDDEDKPILDEHGRFIYNPIDAKTARIEKRAAVLQVASYALAMRNLGMPIPKKVGLWLAGDNEWYAASIDLLDLASEFFNRAFTRIQSFEKAPEPDWAPPKESCGRCRWNDRCTEGRNRDRDLSLVQDIRATSRKSLVASGIKTIDDLARAKDEDRPKLPREMSKETYNNLRDQASIQVRGQDAVPPLHEIRDAWALGSMPPESPGDIWFDMEGDPFAIDGKGLEYMFGVSYFHESDLEFRTFEGLDREAEGEAFHDFMKWVIQRQRQFPDMHIFHYASYETTALKRLAQLHGIMELEVDDLLRNTTFIDLYSIVRRGFRFSTTSLSIKYIEPVYGVFREGQDIVTSFGSVLAFENALGELESGNQIKFEEIMIEIRSYNRVDCESTQKLDKWIRAEALRLEIPLLELYQQTSEEDAKANAPSAVGQKLLEFVPRKIEDRTNEQQAIALLAAATRFHNREARPQWWELFTRAEADLDEMGVFDDVLLIDNPVVGEWTKGPKARFWHRVLDVDFADYDPSLLWEEDKKPTLLYDRAPGDRTGFGQNNRDWTNSKVNAVTSSALSLDETGGKEQWDEIPIAILPGKPIDTTSIEQMIIEALAVPTASNLESGLPPFNENVWSDLLLRRHPRQISHHLPHENPEIIEDIIQAILDSDESYIAVQGPPGTGKTFIGANVIARLIKKGWKIGVVAQSHAVIENILDGVLKLDPTLAIGKNTKHKYNKPPYHQEKIGQWVAMQHHGYVVGGTAWTFCGRDLAGLELDLMVIDEAGQFSLANSIAVTASSRRALLLGDPQQLPQVSQANHPEPVEVSVMGHILNDQATMPPEFGYFLEKSYRMHPEVTEPVSVLQYEGKLKAHPNTENRNLIGVSPGLKIIEIAHSENNTSSMEEAVEVLSRINELIGTPWHDVDKSGKPMQERPLNHKDFLVVAAYNKQVRLIKSLLKSNKLELVRVGTFDKFQGQEAPVVLVSMATSSSDELPRGIEFLLNPNRINVAISRAQWICYLIRSPQLSYMEPTSANGMLLLGKFVRLCAGRKQLSS
jgi:uncharacterized protein